MPTPDPKSPLHFALGQQFQKVRRECQVWQPDLAKAIGCSINTIRWHEMGIRMLRTDMLYKAARAMNVDPSTLMDIDH